MIDATEAAEAAEAARRMFSKVTDRSPYKSQSECIADAEFLLKFAMQVERERAAMPAKLERLRDEFAGQALTGLLSNPGDGPLAGENILAREAWALADAMLEARGKKP